MTRVSEPIRQASMFTMGGLPDPRLMPDYVDEKSRQANGDEQKDFELLKIFSRVYIFLSNPFSRKLSNTQRGV